MCREEPTSAEWENFWRGLRNPNRNQDATSLHRSVRNVLLTFTVICRCFAVFRRCFAGVSRQCLRVSRVFRGCFACFAEVRSGSETRCTSSTHDSRLLRTVTHYFATKYTYIGLQFTAVSHSFTCLRSGPPATLAGVPCPVVSHTHPSIHKVCHFKGRASS